MGENMKKNLSLVICLLLTAVLSLFSFACSSGSGNSVADSSSEKTKDDSSFVEEDLTKYDLDSYDLEKYLSPYWSGNVSYAESVFVLQDKTGNIAPINLLYPIEKMVSVRSADLMTLFEEGRDYEIQNGKLVIKKDGAIPSLAYTDYYHETYVDDGLKTQIPAANGNGSYIVAEISKESKGMSQWCVACTYTHAESKVLTAPEDKSQNFETLSAKLANKQDISIAYYGDSITYGWSATGMSDINREPYCPFYGDMVADVIEKKFDVKTTRKNYSVSGKDSVWAKEYDNYIEVANSKPDLLILAFGMNDGVVRDATDFVANIKVIVKNINAKSPDTQIVVVSPMVPNDLVGYVSGTSLRVYQPDYPEELASAEEYWAGKEMPVAVANVTDVHLQMLKVKSFQDCTSSNTNHPNDYIHRLYAQVVLKTILGI